MRKFFKIVGEYMKALNDVELLTGGIKDFWYGKARKKIVFERNEIKSNVDLKELKATLKKEFEELKIMVIAIKYNDGALRYFDEMNWHLFGRDIMKNRQGIKVIVIKKRK